MKIKKFNHAFTVAFSLDTNMSRHEYCEFMETKKGLAELAGHMIHRAMQILEDEEYEAYELWDSYEH